ncbi:hypothetical protein EGW08_004361, partial [Elysia chlorotica]
MLQVHYMDLKNIGDPGVMALVSVAVILLFTQPRPIGSEQTERCAVSANSSVPEMYVRAETQSDAIVAGVTVQVICSAIVDPGDYIRFELNLHETPEVASPQNPIHRYVFVRDAPSEEPVECRRQSLATIRFTARVTKPMGTIACLATSGAKPQRTEDYLVVR